LAAYNASSNVGQYRDFSRIELMEKYNQFNPSIAAWFSAIT